MPSPLACLSRAPLLLGPKLHSWVCYEGYQDVIILFFFQASAMAQIVLLFFGSLLLALSLSQEMSPRCLQLAVQKKQWLQCSCRLMGSLQKYFYSRLLQNMISATSV